MKISLERWALIAEITSALAVVLSVIYLGLEVRQNTFAMKSLTHQQMFETTSSLNQSIANNRQLADLLARSNKNYSELDDGEKNQLMFLWINGFNMWHSGYLSWQAGFFDEEAWVLWDHGMTKMLSSYRASREVWSVFDDAYNSNFQKHVNTIIGRIGPVKNETGVLSD